MTDEALQACIRDEETYQFASFSHQDAWEMGNEIIRSCKQMSGPLAVEIEINHVVVFRFLPDGTGKFHEQWLQRKRNTVNTVEKSTLRVFYELEKYGETLEKDWLLPLKDYADCGGAFPIRIRNGSVVGVAAVSGLDHLDDNFALMEGMKNYWLKHQA